MSKVLADSSYSFYSTLFRFIGASDELTDIEKDEINAAVDLLMLELERSMLIGAIMPYVGLTVPKGCLKCDNTNKRRVDFPELYAYLVGSPLIVDANTFKTPFFTGRVVAMANDFVAPRYTQVGAATQTLTIPNLPAHSHTYTPPVANVDLEGAGALDPLAAGIGVTPVNTSSVGSGTPFSIFQPTVYFDWCIVSGMSLNAP